MQLLGYFLISLVAPGAGNNSPLMQKLLRLLVRKSEQNKEKPGCLVGKSRFFTIGSAS